MIEIDGSAGEGGGQVLRAALSVACVLGKQIRITKIRAGRENPGLRAQHLTVCRLLAEITGAKMEGAAIGSSEIIFEPGEISGGEFSFDIGTAGSCTLLLQAALPVLLSADAPCSLRIRGGTHVRGAPTYEYFSEVFLPAARRFGAKCGSELLSYGFYPKGGGEVALCTEPSALNGASFSQEGRERAGYSIISSGLPQHVAEREGKKIAEMLPNHTLEGGARSVHAACAGNAVSIWSGAVGASAIGETGKPAEKVAEEACESFLGEVRACAAVDSHLADQLLPYAALAGGQTRFSTGRFTPHLETIAGLLCSMTGRNIILGAEREVRVG